MTDFLEKAKLTVLRIISTRSVSWDQRDAAVAQAYALIAIAERLERTAEALERLRES